MARQYWVMGNWKMNGSFALMEEMAAVLKRELSSEEKRSTVIFPPFTYLNAFPHYFENALIQWGAQTVSSHENGAYTGEVSAKMLKELGCQYVILGHSERRRLCHESNEMVAAQFEIAKQYDLTPVLCVGETLEQRKQNETLKVVLTQVEAIILHCGIEVFEKAIIAYEPVWAIGTGLTATPTEAETVHEALRRYVATFNEDIAEALPILYGGSVTAENAFSLFSMANIDGGLIGGASLKPKDFVAIIQEAQRAFSLSIEESW